MKLHNHSGGIVFSPDEPPTGEQVPVSEPPAAAPDIESIINERVRAEVDRRLAAPQPQPVQQREPVTNHSPFERAKADAEASGIYDPDWITNRAIALAGEDMERRLMERIAPTLQRLAQKETVLDLSSGLGKAGREYIQRLAPGLDPNMIAVNNELRDLVTRAARDYDREFAPVTPARVNVTPEQVGEPSGTVLNAQARSELAEFNRLTGESLTEAEWKLANDTGMPEQVRVVL